MKNNLEMVKATDELRKLILEHPELPLVVLAGENACTYDYSSMFCTDVRAYIGEFLDCEQPFDEERAYDDRVDFEDAVREYYEDYCDEHFDGNEAEYEEYIEKKIAEYDPYWKKCIILYVDN